MELVKNDGYTIKGVKITPSYAKLTRVYMELESRGKINF